MAALGFTAAVGDVDHAAAFVLAAVLCGLACTAANRGFKGFKHMVWGLIIGFGSGLKV